MIIRNSNMDELGKALEETNKKFENNIKFKRLEQKSKNSINMTLTVNNSRAKGGRIGFSGKRVTAACWHAHGTFFDNLFDINPNVKIITAGNTMECKEDNWKDYNIGSIMSPLYYSEACDC